jgi:hypothetical protein
MSRGWQMGWYNGWSPAVRMATLPIQREAIRSGRIAAPETCSICGVTPEPGSNNPVGLHDEDYSQPLLTYHICQICHRTLHGRFEHLDPWRTLVRTHGSGSRGFEGLTIDPASQRQPFEVMYPAGLPRD